MDATEICHIERIQDPALRSGVVEMILIRALDHAGLEGGEHVNATDTERLDQRIVHGIFIEVKPRHQTLRPDASASASRRSASSSSAAMSASIRSRFA